MKIVSHVLLSKLAFLSLLLNTQAKLVRTSGNEQITKSNNSWVDVYNRGQRHLEGEAGKKISMEAFKMSIKALLEKEIKDRFGEESLSQNDTEIFVQNPETKVKIFTVKVEETDDEMLQLPMVRVELVLGMIAYTFMLEKTPLKGAPASKCQLIMNNFFYLVDQYIVALDDLLPDLGVALGMMIVSPRGKQKEAGKDRILREVSQRRVKQLKTIAIQEATQVYPLNLEKKRYTSKNEDIQKNIRKFGRQLKNIKRHVQDRNLTGEGGDSPDVLTAANIKYMTNKAEVFSGSKLKSDIFMKLALVDGPTMTEDKNSIQMLLSPSESEIGDVTFTISKLNNGIQKEFRHPAFTVIYMESIPTKRFCLKNLPNQFKEVIRVLEIVFNLNNLRMWFDNGNDLYPRQRVIKELFQPTLIYLMYRQEFDNKTDGITEADNGFDSNILKYKHSNAITDDNWWMEVYDMRPEPKQLFHDRISFKEYGEGFLVAHFETNNFFLNQNIRLGLRQFPDMSMFNQHFLAVRYIQMQVEFAVRVLNLKIFRDYITPFPIRALEYPDKGSIPIMQKKWWTLPQPKRIRDLTDSPSVQNFDEKIKMKSELCPIASLEFSDSIRIHPSSGGSGMSYSLSHNTRAGMAWEVDYCSYPESVDAGGGGGEERRLSDDAENAEGFLV